VLRLTFNFEPEEYTSLRENNVTFKEGRNSKLIIRTVGSRNLDLDSPAETHTNPIGQTGVHINVVIIAAQHFYNISVNGGDFIHYHHRFPPWAVNHVMV